MRSMLILCCLLTGCGAASRSELETSREATRRAGVEAQQLAEIERVRRSEKLCSTESLTQARQPRQLASQIKRVSPKSEFESTSDFYTRASSIQKINTNNISLIAPIAYGRPGWVDKLEYDADKALLTLNLTNGILSAYSADFDSEKYYMEYYIKVDGNTVGSSVTGYNIFGAGVTVKRWTGRHIGLIIGKFLETPSMGTHGWPHHRFAQPEKLVFPMKKDEAKDTKSNIAVMFKGDLVPPYLTYGRSTTSASLDRRWENDFHVTALIINLKCAAIVNTKTLSILHHINLR